MAPEGQRRLRRHSRVVRRDRPAGGLRVVVSDTRGRPVRGAGLDRWLSRVAPPRARGVVGVVLAGDARVRALNRTFRGIDRVTDVLSFPLTDPQSRRRRSPGAELLGDIVIARGLAARQAREAGHSETTELRVLALHGLLHLLGYDHEDGSAAMARTEQRLRRKGGLRQGLIERAGSQ